MQSENAVVHFEIPTKDLERAKTFYSTLFGWQLQDMPEMDYTIVQTVETDENQMPKEAGAINGGMTKDDPTAKGPVIVINVADIDAKLKEAAEAGAEVVLKKIEVGDMGLYARVTDPEGNVIGLWQDLKGM